ncbi:MAG: topoisomerase DNA-binding C4 zinc finger domain-containing protein [Eubacterium sp.]
MKRIDKASGNCVTYAQMTDIYEKLYPFTQTSEEEKEKHVENIRNKHSRSVESNRNMMICPRCGNELVLRTVKRGENAGKQFYGCGNYPKCRYIRDINR